MPSTSTKLLLLLNLLALSACSDQASEANGELGATVELLDAGQGTLRTLAFEPGDGATQSVALKCKMSMGIDYDGQAIPAETIPATSTTLEFTPGGPNDCGFRIAGAAIVDYGSDMERLAHVNRELTNQDPVDHTGSLTRSPNGQVLLVDFEIPPASTSTLRHFFGNLKQALQQVCVPLPDTAVGAGARWKVPLPVHISGMDLTQNGLYELKSIDGEQLSVEFSANMLAEPQLFQLPNMPASSRCELIELNGQASGQLVIDLAKRFPVEAHLEYRFDMRMRVQNEGQVSELNSHVEMKFDVTTP